MRPKGGIVLTRPSLHPVPPCRPGLIHWRRPRRPARRGRIPLSENALAQTGAGTATVVLLTAIMALIDVGVYDICRVDSGLPKRFGRKLSDAALIVACRNASVWRMIHRVVSMAWNHGCARPRAAESFIGIVHMDGGIMKGWPGEPDMEHDVLVAQGPPRPPTASRSAT